MEIVKSVELGELSRELTGLVAGASWAGGAAIVGRARELLARVASAPAREPTYDPEARPSRGWQAVRTTSDPSEEEIVCWSATDDAQLRGRWRAGKLTGIWVQVGDDFWSSEDGKLGETWTSSKDDTAGPGGEAFGRRIDERLRAAMQEVAQERPQLGWVCARCGWDNAGEDGRCRGCLAPHAAGVNDALAAGSGAVGGMGAAPAEVRGERSASGEMEMPGGWEDLVDELRGELLRKVKDGLSKVAEADWGSATKGDHAERKCVHCRKPIGTTHRFCPECGAEQPASAANPK